MYRLPGLSRQACRPLAGLHRTTVPSKSLCGPVRTIQVEHRAKCERRFLTSARSSAAQTSTAPGIQKDYFQGTDTRPIILYDGVCNLCNGAVDLMLQIDPTGRFRMAALQSPAGRRLLQQSGRAPDDISSIVLVDQDQAYIKSEAVLRIAAGLNVPLAALAWAGFPVPRFIRDTMYDMVADNRYNLMGKRSCRVMEERFRERFVVD